MKKILLPVLLLALVAGGYYWYGDSYAVAASFPGQAKIVGSGVIEAQTIVITSETGGRIAAVHVREGEEVTAGDVLVELDSSLLKAQQVELEAAINTALANLEAVKAPPPGAEIAVAEAELAQARAQAEGARQISQQMLQVSQDPQELLLPIQDVQAQIEQAKKAVESAEVSQRSAGIQEERASRDQSSVGKVIYQVTQKRRQAADVGVDLAKANLQALQTQLAHLQEQYNNPIALQAQADQAAGAARIAEAAVTLAEARLAAAEKGPRVEDIAVAEVQVRVAESARALLAARMSQLILTAPRDGLITTRTAEPGETAIPGAILLSLADLNQIKLRVFVPETQIGRVKLGQTARVTIDSVDQPFTGVVTYIANEAEFTPQNVQIAEERVNLVFAVEVSLDNPEHILKPGMPADAEIVP